MSHLMVTPSPPADHHYLIYFLMINGQGDAQVMIRVMIQGVEVMSAGMILLHAIHVGVWPKTARPLPD